MIPTSIISLSWKIADSPPTCLPIILWTKIGSYRVSHDFLPRRRRANFGFSGQTSDEGDFAQRTRRCGGEGAGAGGTDEEGGSGGEGGKRTNDE